MLQFIFFSKYSREEADRAKNDGVLKLNIKYNSEGDAVLAKIQFKTDLHFEGWKRTVSLLGRCSYNLVVSHQKKVKVEMKVSADDTNVSAPSPDGLDVKPVFVDSPKPSHTYFRCPSYGYARNLKEKTDRPHSRKDHNLHCSCTSSMIKATCGDEVIVVFRPTHVNHNPLNDEQDRYITLSDAAKNKAKEMLSAGINESTVLQAIRDLGKSDTETYGLRAQMFDKKQLENLKNTLNISGRHDVNDGISTHSILEEWNTATNSCVLLHKVQNTGVYYTQKNPNSTDPIHYVHAIDESWELKLKIMDDIDLMSGNGHNGTSNTDDSYDINHGPSPRIRDPFYTKLPEHSFCVVLQTEEQRALFRKYGGKCVYMDASHSTNQYGFLLMTLMVEDTSGAGRAVAFCVTSSTDEHHVTAFLHAVQTASPDVQPDVFMTDDDNTEWSAIQNIYPHAVRFLCKFHVIKSWERNLVNKGYSDAATFDKISGYLQTLINEPDVAEFDKLLVAFKEVCAFSAPKFFEYFTKRWLSVERIKMWALCYRMEMGYFHCTTNNFVESFHRVFKHSDSFMNGKANNRVDQLLLLLMKYESEQNFQTEYSRRIGCKLRNDWRKVALISGAVKLKRTDITMVCDETVDMCPLYTFQCISQSDNHKKHIITYHKTCHCDILNEVFCDHVFTCDCRHFKSTGKSCYHIGGTFKYFKDALQKLPAESYIGGCYEDTVDLENERLLQKSDDRACRQLEKNIAMLNDVTVEFQRMLDTLKDPTTTSEFKDRIKAKIQLTKEPLAVLHTRVKVHNLCIYT